MYEKITAYLDAFESGAPEAELKKAAEAFANDFAQSGFMVQDAMEAMGDRAWASKSELKDSAPSMTAEEACVCLSAFLQQDSFLPGVLLDLIQQGVVPQFLKRLRELDA